MDSHNKVVIVALSLSVLTLASISTYLSLRQSQVLGETTAGPNIQPVLPPSKKPFEVSCQEYIHIYKTYCRPVTKTDSTIQAPELTEEENNSVSTNTTTSDSAATSLRRRLCSDLYKVGRQFCRSVVIEPRPSTVCKSGVNSFTVGATCDKGAVSATYACHDGTTGIVEPKTLIAGKSCYPIATLEQMAKKACEGHSACSDTPDGGTPPSDGYCTGDKDCKAGEKCVLPAMVGSSVSIVDRNLPGKCVPVSSPTLVPKTTVTPSPRSCGWCGTSCTFVIPGRACVQIANPNKSCVMSDKGICQIIPTSPVKTR